jgi:iron complex transport system permease protein
VSSHPEMPRAPEPPELSPVASAVSTLPRPSGSPATPATSPEPKSGRLLPLLLLVGVTLVLLLATLLVGTAGIPPGQVIGAVFGAGDDTARTIVLQLRLPRAILALLVGGGLALAGTVFQALLRNPLAEPYVLGVSGGAAVGAVSMLVLGWAATSAWILPAGAFVGAAGAILLVFRIAAGVGRALDTRVLLLAGVVVGAFFNALILLLLTLSDAETFRDAFFWLLGSLAMADWPQIAVLAAYLVPGIIILLALARPLNLLGVGEETALYLGTRVDLVKRVAYVVASLIVAATVSIAGVIGFVGLVVPHAVRMLWGAEHRLLLPASMVAGGAFLLIADTAARTVAAPAELPVGVVTSLVGVPLFVLLLARHGR